MEGKRFTIQVPGSTANLGPGFDSIGLAVTKYLTLHVYNAAEWRFKSCSVLLEGLPEGKENMMYEVAESIAKQYGKTLPPCYVEVYSDIPLARGLGSSAAAIVGAIELANQLLGCPMTEQEKLRHACLIEGHPDNVAASLFGGLVIGFHDEEETHVLKAGVPDFELVALIPDFELKTSEARDVLPKEVPYKQAIKGSAISNVIVAALLKRDYHTAGKLMQQDVFHEPYRKQFLPKFDEIREFGAKHGAFAVTLSGAGPTLLAFVPEGEGEKMQAYFAKAFPMYAAHLIEPAQDGVVVEKTEATSLT